MKFKINRLMLKISAFGFTVVFVSFALYVLVFLRAERRQLTTEMLHEGMVFSEFSAPTIYDAYIEYYTHLTQNSFNLFKTKMHDILSKDTDIVHTQLVGINGKILFEQGELTQGKYFEKKARFIRDPRTLEMLKSEVIVSLNRGFEHKAVTEIVVPITEVSLGHVVSVVYVLSYQSLEQRMQLVYRHLLLTMVPVLLLTVLIVVPFSVTLSNPVEKLHRLIEKIRKGDLDTRVEVNTNDEIGDLADAFNEMTSDLKQSRSKLEEYSKSLEKLVAERTKALEDAMQHVVQSEQKYRSMMDATNNEVYICSSDFIIEYINPAMSKRVGLNASSMNCYQVLYGLDRKCTWCIQDRVQQGEHGEIEIVSPKNGCTYHVSGSPIFHEDGSISAMMINRNITEQKKLEEELLNARKLESLGILAGGIAHDFNNLLMMITGYISLAEFELNPEDSAYMSLQEAQDASRRAKKLTKQLITFSQGGAPVRREGAIDVLIETVANQVIEQTAAKLKFSCPQGIRRLKFDEGQMSHAFQNIIVNAAESMPGGGTVTVTVDNLAISSENADQNLLLSEGDYVKISIQDQGVGVSEEHLLKIYDPYFSTKEMGAQKGIGLGLTTAYSIIKKHNGTIDVQSSVGNGSTFSIYLPADEKGHVRVDPGMGVKPSYPTDRKGKILVMDDEEVIRDLSRETLVGMGYAVETAKDGAEAIRVYRASIRSHEPFDAVLLDLSVKGGLGGEDAVKTLLKINPQAKVIVCSGYPDDPVMKNYTKYGFSGALAKPYAIKILHETLDAIIHDTVGQG
ncbi:MAG: response regulator [Desulfobacterales bacterium]|nr:response regulator [Desulfobacterales bacterium]